MRPHHPPHSTVEHVTLWFGQSPREWSAVLRPDILHYSKYLRFPPVFSVPVPVCVGGSRRPFANGSFHYVFAKNFGIVHQLCWAETLKIEARKVGDLGRKLMPQKWFSLEHRKPHRILHELVVTCPWHSTCLHIPAKNTDTQCMSEKFFFIIIIYFKLTNQHLVQAKTKVIGLVS